MSGLSLKSASLVESFTQRFGEKPRIFSAPGRVNLIGEHTDYNEGFVMPAAIEFRTTVAISPRHDRKLKIVSREFKEESEFNLDDLRSTPAHRWSDYVIGVVRQLMDEGGSMPGANLMLAGEVPIGAGISSSASVEVSVALALSSSMGRSISRAELARLCQRAENEFVGARCGIMDQFVSANGRRGHALMLDCRSLEFELISLPAALSIVICNTMIKHQIAGGEYNIRRRQCEEATAILQRAFPGVKALRDVSVAELESQRNVLPEVLYRRSLHVVSEDERVLAMADALRRGDLDCVGRQMAQSHRSLRDNYEVSCPELDMMVELATGQPGVIGARMTGGGFGGCTVNFVRDELVNSFRKSVSEAYKQKTGLTPEIYVTRAADGATEAV